MVCGACGHKHEVWDNESLEMTYLDTKPFIRIEGKFEKVVDLRWSDTTLYACPKCYTIRITDTI